MQDTLFQEQYQKLNPEQKEAVDTLYGPVMVVAGPGTGKTQIIGMRTANILRETDTDPGSILITTFTEAGVIAIRERLISFIGNEAYKVNVSTIHSFASGVIERFPEKFIEYRTAKAIDDVEQIEVIKQILDLLIEKKQIIELTSEYDRYFYLRDIKSKISTLKQEGINVGGLQAAIKQEQTLHAEELALIKPKKSGEMPKKYETTKERQEKQIAKLEELVLLFQEYNAWLRSNSSYDFNDMINFVLEKFGQDEDLLLYYAEKFQFIMLDEYQDTNNAQNEIIKLIVGIDNGISPTSSEEQYAGPNIMVVGDDDQSIYRFQGANIENMLDFSVAYPNTKFIVLKQNYRSTQGVLDLAHTLIENNTERLSNSINSIQKELVASGKYAGEREVPTLYRATSDIDEQSYVIGKIKELINTPISSFSIKGGLENGASFSSKGSCPESSESGKGIDTNYDPVSSTGGQLGVFVSEIAILVRNNREVKLWSDLLLQHDIPVVSKLKSNILESSYIKYLLGYLRLVIDPYADEKGLIDIMRSHMSGLIHTDVLKVNHYLYRKNYTRKQKITMMDFLVNFEQPEEDFPGVQEGERILSFRDRLLRLHTEYSLQSVSHFLYHAVEETGLISYIDTHGSFDDLQDVYTLLNTIKTWILGDKSLTLAQILAKIELYTTYNYPINRQIVAEENKGVQIMTAHGSKGLEYEAVFVPGLYVGNWDDKRVVERVRLPLHLAGKGLQELKDSQLEEDRRLFFVACTRAKKSLYLSYPAGSGTKPLLASQFLEEIEGTYTSEESIEPRDISHKDVILGDVHQSLYRYETDEFQYIEEFLKHYRLSPSDLNTFLEDPIEFLHRTVFRYPFQDNVYTIFGKVYHRTLELFYLKYKRENTLPEKSYLTSTFRLLLEKEVLTPEEYESLLEKGQTGLEGYFDTYSKNIQIPVELEYSFRNKNILFDGVPLTGTIDKIELVKSTSPLTPLLGGEGKDDGQQALFRDSVRLIDYKTGKPKTLGQIKGLDRYGNKKPGEGKYARQLMFYRLLCELDPLFHRQYDIGGLVIDFVEGKDEVYKSIEVEVSSEEYDAFKEELRTAWQQISDINFWKVLLTKTN